MRDVVNVVKFIGVLAVAVGLATFGASAQTVTGSGTTQPVLSRAQGSRNSWAELSTLHAGQRVEIVETNLKKHNGTFSVVTDDAIQLREGGSDVGIKKENVMRVTLLDKSHRLRNSFLLGGLGAGAGAGIGAAASRCSSTSNSFTSCGFGRGIVIGIGAVAGLAGGAGIGAAIPSHPTVYRTEQH